MKDVYRVLLAPSHRFAAVAVLGLLYLLGHYIRDPLSQVLGSWYTKWTFLVMKYHWLKGNRARYQHALHLKYSKLLPLMSLPRYAFLCPLVRFTPNEVSVTNIESVKKIHNARETYRKTSWYGDLLRWLPSGAMSETSLQIAFSQVQSKIDLAIQRMGEEMGSRGAANAIEWFLFMATDIIGELSFGDSFRTLEIGEKGGYTKDLGNLGYLGAVCSAFLTLISMAKYLPIPFFTRPLRATRNMIHTFTKVFKDTDKDALTPVEQRANTSGYIVAGSDSTAVTLTYLVWSVCRNPTVKATLLEQLRSLPNGFNASHLRDLSYLNQVIDETLRLYSGIQSSLPRHVPEGDDDVAGYWLPGGTSICPQAYSMHRIASVFPNPDVFDPSRWASPTREMKDSFMPFGNGSQICIGLHLARMELRCATARFFLTYPEAKVSTLKGFSDDGMLPKVFFFEEPKAQRRLIQRC
ncbi:cytochrome P450 [Trichoderma pleuroticola]